ncbi:MAG: sigma-54 dependent transcriptional regulator [Acidobacteriaceae bacterium]
MTAHPGLQRRVLIVDDELNIRFALGEYLRTRNLAISEAETCRSAEEVFCATKPDIVILDNFLPDGTALDLMPRLKAWDTSVPVIILTGHASIDLAVRAIKEGAEHFVTKPVDLHALVVLIERLLELQRSRRREVAAHSHPRRRDPDPFFGNAPAIRLLRGQAQRVAEADSAVVLQGETGSGKGVLARWLHQHSARADEPFVDLNCAGLSRDFLETELFGHEKGAFTSAVVAKQGLLEVAHRGTLFLDEIGDIDPLVQPKILKALEEKRFRRMGEVKDRTVDTRLIAASHHDLGVLVQQGRFRSDLYFRINTIPLRVPALRERAQDIPLLAQMLLADICADLGKPGKTLAGNALDELRGYRWPGNVRELRNVLERAILLGSEEVIERSHLLFDRESDRDAPGPGDLTQPGVSEGGSPIRASARSMTLQEMERWHIETILNSTNGKVDAAAALLDIPRSSLYQKLKRYRIEFHRSVSVGE